MKARAGHCTGMRDDGLFCLPSSVCDYVSILRPTKVVQMGVAVGGLTILGDNFLWQ